MSNKNMIQFESEIFHHFCLRHSMRVYDLLINDLSVLFLARKNIIFPDTNTLTEIACNNEDKNVNLIVTGNNNENKNEGMYSFFVLMVIG